MTFKKLIVAIEKNDISSSLKFAVRKIFFLVLTIVFIYLHKILIALNMKMSTFLQIKYDNVIWKNEILSLIIRIFIILAEYHLRNL